MITMLQAITADSFHCTREHDCTRTIGPRGGVKESITTVRRNGVTKTWKTRPKEFKIPVKFGLYAYGYIDHDNLAMWHVASECPLLEEG